MTGRAIQYARWAETQRIGRGDAVALLMENRPNISSPVSPRQRGAVIALINTNLRGEALAHCLEVTRASGLFGRRAFGGLTAPCRH